VLGCSASWEGNHMKWGWGIGFLIVGFGAAWWWRGGELRAGALSECQHGAIAVLIDLNRDDEPFATNELARACAGEYRDYGIPPLKWKPNK
jgi:hypothetical protein